MTKTFYFVKLNVELNNCEYDLYKTIFKTIVFTRASLKLVSIDRKPNDCITNRKTKK